MVGSRGRPRPSRDPDRGPSARFGSYAPENFDQTFQGTVTVRRALQLSLNMPAVTLMEKIGTTRFVARLEQAGAPLAFPPSRSARPCHGTGRCGRKPERPRWALYARLARFGTTLPLVEQMPGRTSKPAPTARSSSAWYIGNILLGTPPPENAAGGRIAFKTGTWYGLSGRLGSRFRWQAHHRGMGWQAGWSTRPWAHWTQRRGAHSVRCVCPHRKNGCSLAGAARGHACCVER